MPTKLPHCLLPVYPALTLLSAQAWFGTAGAMAGHIGYRRLLHWLWLGLGILPPLLMLADYLYLHAGSASHFLAVAACTMAVADAAAAPSHWECRSAALSGFMAQAYGGGTDAGRTVPTRGVDSGINYGRGENLDLQLLASTPDRALPAPDANSLQIGENAPHPNQPGSK